MPLAQTLKMPVLCEQKIFMECLIILNWEILLSPFSVRHFWTPWNTSVHQGAFRLCIEVTIWKSSALMISVNGLCYSSH